MLRFFEATSKWRGKPELETVSPSFHHRRFFRPFPPPFDCYPFLSFIRRNGPMRMD